MTRPASSAARGIATAMVPDTDQSSVRRRWGIIKAVNGNGTVNVDVAGVTISNVKRLASYRPSVNERVQIDVVGTDMVVSGATAPSQRGDMNPIGDIEPTLRRTPKTGTLLLDGAQVSRTTYADLWAWVQAQNLITAGLFTTGNGTTTFGLPDFRNRYIMGLPAAGTPGAIVGSNTKTLTTANLPAHKHDVAVAAHAQHTHSVTVAAHAQHNHTMSGDGGHNHGFSTGGGGHGHSLPVDFCGNEPHGHNARPGRIAEGPNIGGAGADASTDSAGEHSHSGNTDTEPDHTHTINNGGPTTHNVTESSAGPTTHAVTETTVGTGTAFDARPESISLNWLIWV